jgi:hypothetical protein
MFFHVHAFDIKNEFRRRYAGAKDYRKCQRDFFNEQKKSLNDALIRDPTNRYIAYGLSTRP